MTNLLAVNRLDFTFPSGLRALCNVDFAVSPGERHAIIGCNGAGKTTLLNLLAGTIRPSAGTVALDGRPVNRLPSAARARRGIGRTFQTPAVLSTLSVRDNVTIGLRPFHRGFRARRDRTARAMETLEDLGIAELADTTVARLSHGQRRLVELASVLAARPRVLLLDEPAAGLTGTDIDRLRECLTQLPADLSLVIVEHHQDLVAAIAETVTVLHHGEVLRQGTPREVAADPDVIRVYLGA